MGYCTQCTTHLGIYCTDYTYGLDDDTVYKIHSVMYMYIYYISCMLFAIFSVLVTKLDHMKDTFQYQYLSAVTRCYSIVGQGQWGYSWLVLAINPHLSSGLASALFLGMLTSVSDPHLLLCGSESWSQLSSLPASTSIFQIIANISLNKCNF